LRDVIVPCRSFVRVRIEEAGDTLRRVPVKGVPGFRSLWPDPVQEAVEAYGYTDVVLRLPPASPRAIDRMHEAFGWFRHLEDQRHLTIAMWMTVARRMGPRRVADVLGIHRNTVMQRRDDALDLIADGLRGDLAHVPKVPQCAVFPLR
jgi:hypothetical protein